MDRWIRRGALLVAVLLAFSLLIAPGCSKKPAPTKDITQETTTPETETEPGDVPETPDTETTDRPMEEAVLEDVFFDYDKYNLRDDARRTLEGNARMLLGDATVRVVLEGHCDERGTVEYNLSLGEKRARSVKNFLMEFGVSADRLSTISYGEERPFALGHNETAWAQNRRVHFIKQ
jgi:peptidoglycan-associated lipoprotein